jgi:hypothetical protein
VTGLFALSGRYAVEGTPRPCDVDGDGKLDLVVITSDSLIVRRGRGDGTFVATPVVTALSLPDSFPTQPLMADFDADGRCDIYYAYPPLTTSSHVATLARGLPDASFQVKSQPQGMTTSLDPAVFYVELGVADVASVRPSAVFLTWQEGFPGHTFDAVSCQNLLCLNPSSSGLLLGAKGTVYGGAVGDVDGDHKDDVLVSYFFQPSSGAAAAPSVALMKGTGSGSFGAGAAIAGLGGYRPYRVYDLDKDGFPDVGAISISDNGYRLFWGDANLSFAASAPLYVGSSGDFDADGNLDLYYNGNSMCVSFGAGGRVFGKRMLLPPVDLQGIGDFNKDGASDAMTFKAGVVSIYVSTAKMSPGAADVQCGSAPAGDCTGPSGF